MNTHTDELLYFWVIGDMHFRAREQWQAIHIPQHITKQWIGEWEILFTNVAANR